jgi:tetratricopeptide (TPR) repeat protein
MEPAISAPLLENPRPFPSLALTESAVAAALNAQKGGTLGELLRLRARATRWFSRRYLRPILGAAGDVLAGEAALAEATTLLLRWATAQMRPDRGAYDQPIEREAWLERTSWRPLLALQCHFGLAQVPEFTDRYRRRADESPVDNLCGLWSIGPSTFYRYIDKGKRQLVEILAAPVTGARIASMRTLAHHFVEARHAAGGEPLAPERRPAWHLVQAEAAQSQRDPCSGLWHLLQAGDTGGFIGVLQRFRIEVASNAETDILIEQFAARAMQPREAFDLRLASAALWRTRNVDERARHAYDQALEIANRHRDKTMLGVIYGELGKFHEARDFDRALSCLENSAEFLRQACADAQAPPQADAAREEYVAALQKLAWFHVLRNDPRSMAVLTRAEQVRSERAVSDRTVALLEQTWGEYWRRASDMRRSIEHKHRALTIFERLGDTREILSTYNNLCLIYSEHKDFDRAIDYAQRVIHMARHVAVDPYILASTTSNLGAAYFWQGRYDQAIEQYRSALAQADAAHEPVLVNRIRYNLAEAHYKRFQLAKDPQDEKRGDEYIARVMQAAASEKDTLFQEAAPQLKREILSPTDGHVHERLWPEELAAHFVEMSEVQRHRTTLALPALPHERIRAHLAIANAYLAISTKEREAALALIREHELGAEFDAEIDALHMTFSRELTREKALLAQWKQKTYGVLTDERANTVLKAVLEGGSINKSGYASLCQVGLATASKHLGTLAERGLLVQTGKGPSTRYVLP